MKRKSFLVLMLSVFILLSGMAWGATRSLPKYSLALSGGVSTVFGDYNDLFGDSAIFHLSSHYRFSRFLVGIRSVWCSYESTAYNGNLLHIMGLLTEFRFDYLRSSLFIGYVSGGAGFMHASVDVASQAETGDNFRFALFVAAGVEVRVLDFLRVFVELPLTWMYESDATFSAMSVMCGVRYLF